MGRFRVSKWRLTRDGFFLALGTVLLVNEFLRDGDERPFLIAAALALMGVTIPLRLGDKETDKRKDPPDVEAR